MKSGGNYNIGGWSCYLEAEGECLTALSFDPKTDQTLKKSAFTDRVCRELVEYFNGRRKAFSFAVRPKGTPFQQRVWHELQKIPYGETISYEELAKRIGNPNACRAVGGANHRNPIAIVIPCHRVIGKNKTLTGYAGGLDKKEQLLLLEAANRTEEESCR